MAFRVKQRSLSNHTHIQENIHTHTQKKGERSREKERERKNHDVQAVNKLQLVNKQYILKDIIKLKGVI